MSVRPEDCSCIWAQLPPVTPDIHSAPAGGVRSIRRSEDSNCKFVEEYIRLYFSTLLILSRENSETALKDRFTAFRTVTLESKTPEQFLARTICIS